MANIKLKSLITEAEDFQAKSKETGKLVHFKSKDAYQAALKAGTHEDPKAKKGGEPKADTKPNNMFGADYTKDRGGDSSSNRKWVNFDKDHSIDTNSGMIVPKGKESDNPNPKDIKGMDSIDTPKKNSNTNVEALASYKDFTKFYKANSDKLNKEDVPYIVDEIEALKYLESDYKRGDADWEEVLVAYEDLQDLIKKSMVGNVEAPKADTPKVNLPKKASQLNYKHAESLGNALNAAVGLDGYVDTDDNTDAIMFHGNSKGGSPTYTIYFGGNADYGKPDEFRVSLLPTYENDPSGLGDGNVDKTFKSAEEAMAFAVEIAKKYKKELEMDDDDTNESTKLTSMIKK